MKRGKVRRKGEEGGKFRLRYTIDFDESWPETMKVAHIAVTCRIKEFKEV